MNLLKIAWRNLWRNKRRTAITSASILFAVFFAIVMRAFQLGTYNHMIKNAVGAYSGFIQIQHTGYQDDPSLENSFECSANLIDIIEKTPGVKAVVPRVETFALASSGSLTKGTLIIGIDPDKERQLSNPENLIVRYRITKDGINKLKTHPMVTGEVIQNLSGMINNSYTNSGTIAMDLDLDKAKQQSLIETIAAVFTFPGQYLKHDDPGVLVSDRLSKYLQLSVGDTLVLMGQGYHGSTSAGLFTVRGIVKFANPELDNKLIYMSLPVAQDFSSLEKNVTTIAINLHDNSDEGMKTMQATLAQKLPDQNTVVKNWKEFNKILIQQIESDNQSGKIFLALLYFIIFFGIFGTVLMMIYERYHEFGVVVAIGMKKTKLAMIMVIEMFFMGLIGVWSGTILSMPVLYYYHFYPYQLKGDLAQVMEDMGWEAVMPVAWIDSYIFWQGLVVVLMVVLSCIYPLRKVLKLKEAEALRA